MECCTWGDWRLQPAEGFEMKPPRAKGEDEAGGGDPGRRDVYDPETQTPRAGGGIGALFVRILKM